MILLHLILSLFTVLAPSPKHYPVPDKSPAHLFYIQRSLNLNTVVYEANFDQNGNLDSHQPVTEFWLMYEADGRKEDLTYLERKFAYGIRHEAIPDDPRQFNIQLASYHTLKLRLKQTAPYKAELLIITDSGTGKLDHIYVQANNAGLYSKVDQLEVYSYKTEKKNLEKTIIHPGK